MVAAAAAVLVLLRLWTPSEDAGAGICFYRRCTGSACPGCGMTRAAASLVRGDWGAAWAYHPLIYLLAAEAIAVTAIVGLVRRGRLGLTWQRHGVWWLAAHIPLLLGVWVVRLVSGTLPV